MNAKIARLPLPHVPVPIRPRAAVVVRLIESGRHRGLAPELVPTDRILERWGVTQGSDEYLHGWDEVPPRSRPPPLPDDLAIVVDQTILRSQVQARKFVDRWYRYPGESITTFAKFVGCHRDTVIMRWNSTLWYMRKRFLEVNIDV